MTTDNPFAAAIERYEFNAALFVEEVLGMDGRDAAHTIDPPQREVLDAVSRRERRIAIRSGHGVGKTAVLAWLIVWILCVIFPQKTVCTAPTGGQLFDALANEVNVWLQKLPAAWQEAFETKAEEIVLKLRPKDSFCSFRTSRAETPEALAGIHREDGWVFIIEDEASGIAESVNEAAAGSMSGANAITILAGNPVRTSGLFYRVFHQLKGLWHTVHISCIGHPRISPDFIEQIARSYGENSNAYRVRVLGDFPKSELDAVISRDLVDAAIERKVEAKKVKPLWGLDPSDQGGDRAGLVKRKGNVMLEAPQWREGLETMQIVGWVKQEWDKTPSHLRPEEILVDSIGVGAGVASRLSELGLPARAINVSESPAMSEKYVNLKTELWDKAREWFEARDCSIIDDEKNEFSEELVAVKFLPPVSSGKMRVEKKRDTKKTLHRSPDLADAFILTLAGDAAMALLGPPTTRDWKVPLKRIIKGII